jgi:quinol monooxygenase YgiN
MLSKGADGNVTRVPGSETIRAFAFWGSEGRMIIVEGFARFAAGEMERLQQEMRAQIEASRAEPGCLEYSYSADVLDPDLMRIIEKWENWDALETHFKAPHMAVFNAAFRAAKVLSIKVDAWSAEHSRTLLGG